MGSIGVNDRGGGTSFPLLQWQVSGPKARWAAEMLGEVFREKRAQLLQLAAQSTEDYEDRENTMRMWKQSPSGVEFQTWHEVAGFVDAEGCFLVHQGVSMLTVGQKHRAPL